MSENLDLVRSICAPWERGEYGFVEWAHPEIELAIVGGPVPGTWRGVEAMGQASRAFLEPLEDLRVAIKRYDRLGSEYVIGIIHATVRGDAGASGRQQVGTSPAIMFRIKDGKVTRLVVYWDGEHALAGVGLKG
jgi:ketosteroid isomerase-like protein